MAETARLRRDDPSAGSISRWLNRFKSSWTIVSGAPIAVFLMDPANVVPVVSFAARAFAGTLPYIVFAVLSIAWLKAAGAEAMVANAFKGRETRMIFLAALFGGLAPFCSCEAIPFIAGLVGGDGVAQVAIAAVFGMPPISTAMWRRPCSPD